MATSPRRELGANIGIVVLTTWAAVSVFVVVVSYLVDYAAGMVLHSEAAATPLLWLRILICCIILVYYLAVSAWPTRVRWVYFGATTVAFAILAFVPVIESVLTTASPSGSMTIAVTAAWAAILLPLYYMKHNPVATSKSRR